MDTLSHALWGKGLFGYRGNGKIAIFFGAMPDLCSFGLLLITRIIKNELLLHLYVFISLVDLIKISHLLC